MARCAIRSNNSGGNELQFTLYRIPRDGKATEAKLTTLKLLVGPGDHREPVVTIMQPDED
jgi:hypothetical protein